MVNLVRPLTVLLLFLLTTGCSSDRTALTRTENLQREIQQSKRELMRARARQSQELYTLKEEDLPGLRGQIEQTQHQAQELRHTQDDMTVRSASLEERMTRLERWAEQNEAVRIRDGAAGTPGGTGDAPLAMRLDTMDQLVDALLVKVQELNSRIDTLEKR